MKSGGIRTPNAAVIFLGGPNMELPRRANVGSIVDGFAQAALVQYLKKLLTALEYSAARMLRDNMAILFPQYDIQGLDVLVDERTGGLVYRMY